MLPIRITVTAMLLPALAGCGGDGETPVTPDARLPDLAVDSLTVARLDPTDAEPVTISFRIRNVGAATTEPTPFIVKIDGTAFGTHRTIPLAAGGVVRMSTTMPPLASGTRRIEVIIDPDDRIEERDEQNNQASVTLSVAGRLSLGQPMAVSSATTDEVILFRVDIDEDARAALNVELAGGSGDADLFVHFGERPPHHYDYECVSGNPASDELCQMVPVRAGPYHVAVHAFTPFGPSTLTVTVGGKPVETFDIEVVFLDHGTPSQDDIIREAARRWESVIARGAVDIDLVGSASRPANECFPGQPAVNERIDDLRVWVVIDSIDGVGGGVARAGPCITRVSLFPASDSIFQETILGDIRLDEADVGRMEANGTLMPIVMHEIAHVLGFGTRVWERRGLLRSPSLPANLGADTHFAGRLATAAFDAAGGTSYAEGAKVPVENRSEQGSSDVHWRESVFDDEIMTPFVGGGHALSLITIESLADLGYGVDVTQAEPYNLPAARPRGPTIDRGPIIDLGDDVARRPIVFIDRKGRVHSF